MSLRRKLLLLIGTAGCVLAFMSFSVSSPGLGTIESAAPPYFTTVASADIATDNEAAMVALRIQANLALAQLQTKAGVTP